MQVRPQLQRAGVDPGFLEGGSYVYRFGEFTLLNR